MKRQENILAWLLQPFPSHRFLRSHWEKKPLVVQRGQADHYASLFSFRDLDSLLASTRRLPGLRLVKAGSTIAAHVYSTDHVQVGGTLYGTVELDRVFSEYQAGATIILEGAHRTWVPLTHFCRNLEKFLSQPIQVNIYITPQAAQGFEAHYDTHDVFVLQVAGNKKWKVFPPTIRLPLRSQTHTERPGARTRALQEFELNPGDLLYLPRGYVHEAVTQSGHMSAHLTVGVMAYTWHDLFREAIDDICERHTFFRKSLPVGFATGGTRRISTKQHTARLTSLLLTSRAVEKSLEMVAEHFVSSREPILNGHLAELLCSDDIKLTTVVRIRDGMLYQIGIEDKSITLNFHGKRVRFPRYVGPALHFISEAQSFQVGRIPDCLDVAGKQILVRRLVKEGFLTTSAMGTVAADLTKRPGATAAASGRQMRFQEVR